MEASTISSSHLIDGVVISNSILNEVKNQVAALTNLSEGILFETLFDTPLLDNINHHHNNDATWSRIDGTKENHSARRSKDELLAPPHLAVVIVGDRPDSLTYVKKKIETCERVGMKSSTYRLPLSITQQELIDLIVKLNDTNNDVDGILVQLPLPQHINEKVIIHSINHLKDVDGLHPHNIGSLASSLPEQEEHKNSPSSQLDQMPTAQDLLIAEMKRLSTADSYLHFFCPCTAEGVIELLCRSNVKIAGAHVTVVGRSSLVGLPVALLLQKRHATVTMCHSKTCDLKSKCSNADILIVAVGRPNFIQEDWVKSGAVVIDVGINAVDDTKSKKGYRLCGDVDFQSVQSKCSKITPVPGGVGPMTVAVLMRNALKARLRRLAQKMAEQYHHSDSTANGVHDN